MAAAIERTSKGLFYTSRRLPFIIVLATTWFSLDSRFHFLHAVARTSGRSSAKLGERREYCSLMFARVLVAPRLGSLRTAAADK